MKSAPVDVFLEELKELFKKHNTIVNGCGCCDSPFVEPLPDDEDSKRRIDNIMAHLNRSVR